MSTFYDELRERLKNPEFCKAFEEMNEELKAARAKPPKYLFTEEALYRVVNALRVAIYSPGIIPGSLLKELNTLVDKLDGANYPESFVGEIIR